MKQTENYLLKML